MAQNRTWVDVQKKTFTGWANNFLKERIMKINSIETDLEDGVLLINLLEIISGKSFARYNKTARSRFQKIENNGAAVKFIQGEGLKLVGIGAEDIVDGKIKLILGLIWTLILRYQIQGIEAESNDGPRAALLEWARKRVEPYGIKLDNFDKSWQDGRALAALTDSLSKGVFPLDTLSGDAFTDANKAMDIAQDKFNIPKIMDPQDLVSVPDELSVMTYVSYFRDYAVEYEANMENLRIKEEERKKTRADAAHTYAHGPGIENDACHANVVALFTLQACNFYGEPLAHGGEIFKVTVSAADGEPVEAAVTDKKDGTYNVAYMPTSPQQHVVLVTLEETPIKDMPINVKIDGAEARNCTASGPGITTRQSHVGKPAIFTIHANDSNGSPLKNGGDPFEVLVTGPFDEPVETEITDNGDGTYQVTYAPTYPGIHKVDVSIRGEPISGGPFAPIVYRSTPENSFAEGAGLHTAKAKHTAAFIIRAVDVDGKVQTTGEEPFAVLVEGPNPGESVKPLVLDNLDGTYSVTYAPPLPGTYTVTSYLFEQPIKGSPTIVNASITADASKTTLEGPGLVGGQAEKPAKFKIIARDPEGQPRADGGDSFVVKVEGGPSPVEPQVVDNGDGTYDVTYQTEEPGQYTLNVLHDGEHPVTGCPREISIKPAPSAENCYADGPGLGERVFDNDSAEFTIHAVDKNGKPREDGGDVFDLKIVGPNGPVTPEIRDNGDGTYTVLYKPEEVGDYSVETTLNGKPIKGSPHKVNVREGTDAAMSGFGSFTFTVTSKDKKGAAKTFGGDPFEITITGPAEGISLSAKDNNDGTYTGAYSLTGSGRFKIDVRLNGKAIEGSPFVQNVGSVKKDKANPVPTHSTSARAN